VSTVIWQIVVQQGRIADRRRFHGKQGRIIPFPVAATQIVVGRCRHLEAVGTEALAAAIALSGRYYAPAYNRTA